MADADNTTNTTASTNAPQDVATANNVVISTIETNSKAFYKSKIFWLAIATIFLSVADQAKLFGEFLPTEYQGIYTAIIGAAILVARIFSGQTVTLTDKK